MTAFFMNPRIEVLKVSNKEDIEKLIYKELEMISKGSSLPNQTTLKACCDTAAKAGAVTVLIQRNILDPDFLAEYSSYYSKQFLTVARLCSRVHFFSSKPVSDDPLKYLDSVDADAYIGFITLRPLMSAPVGATILKHSLKNAFVRSLDTFPVHIAGKQFNVTGTPFIQQDNAVGACAQASIWVSLRTLRKKEGDRAHDPAQITDAATRYSAIGRIKPNREGLTIIQMIEAIRTAGYSPHRIPLPEMNDHTKLLDEDGLRDAMKMIHPYIESEIPVILILSHNGVGHAMVIIGHTWNKKPLNPTFLTHTIGGAKGPTLSFTHAVSWVPELVVHNDNSGPYMVLPKSSRVREYALNEGTSVIPLLPQDVFLSAEEALGVGELVLTFIYNGLRSAKVVSDSVLVASSKKIACRLLLVEKRKLRAWAATNRMGAELASELRMMELPKRVWVFELHLKANYGNHGKTNEPSLIGFILIDPTGDESWNSMLMIYMNKDYPDLGFHTGVMGIWDANRMFDISKQVTDSGPLQPMRA